MVLHKKLYMKAIEKVFTTAKWERGYFNIINL